MHASINKFPTPHLTIRERAIAIKLPKCVCAVVLAHFPVIITTGMSVLETTKR
jgi:hypothetical protein